MDLDVLNTGGVCIKALGNYFLPKNLVLHKTGIDGFVVHAPDVSINLNGSSILGPGKGTGIGVNAEKRPNLIVVNGSVVGMGHSGILAGDNVELSTIHSDGIGDAGIKCGNGCLITIALGGFALAEVAPRGRRETALAAKELETGLDFADSTSGFTGNILSNNHGISSGVAGQFKQRHQPRQQHLQRRRLLRPDCQLDRRKRRLGPMSKCLAWS